MRPALRSRDEDERVEAALLISEFGGSADEILAVLRESATDLHSYLTEALEDDNPKVRRAAAEVAGRVRPAGKDVVAGMTSDGPAPSYLTTLLQDDNPDLRRTAAEALGQIGPAAQDAVPRLIELLDDEDSWDAAAEALGHIGPAARAAVPKLLEPLKVIRQLPDLDEYDYIPGEYVACLDALAGIGSGARDAAPELLRLANFDDRSIRGGAVLALARIDPTQPSLHRRMRRLLAECERKSAIGNIGSISFFEGNLSDNLAGKIADTVWELGPRRALSARLGTHRDGRPPGRPGSPMLRRLRACAVRATAANGEDLPQKRQQAVVSCLTQPRRKTATTDRWGAKEPSREIGKLVQQASAEAENLICQTSSVRRRRRFGYGVLLHRPNRPRQHP